MAIVLTLISVVAGAGLALVNSITADKIQALQKQKLDEGICSVLGLDAAKTQIPEAQVLKSGAIAYVISGQGTAVQVTDPNGFGGDLKVLFGFDEKGIVKGYTILETNETPGLGAKAQEWFRTEGNIIGMNPGKNNMTVSKDGGEVQAITASTITSRAFLRALNAAYAALSELENNAPADKAKIAEGETECPSDSVSAETNEPAHDGQTGASPVNHPEKTNE